MKLVDTSDLKSDFYIKSIGSSPITSIHTIKAKMMELVDILGLGSSSFKKSKGSSPFFGKIT